jgi:hypothetical protein
MIFNNNNKVTFRTIPNFLEGWWMERKQAQYQMHVFPTWMLFRFNSFISYLRIFFLSEACIQSLILNACISNFQNTKYQGHFKTYTYGGLIKSFLASRSITPYPHTSHFGKMEKWKRKNNSFFDRIR